MVPNYATICLLFARCDLDMKGVAFPAGHEAFRTAFFKTVEHIRSRYLGENSGQFDDEAWECLRLVLRSQPVLRAFEVTDKREDRNTSEFKNTLRRSAAAIAVDIERRFPAGRVKEAADVQQIVGEWLIPWVLFYTVVPPSPRGW
jgi:hypothetical protein